MPPASSLLSSRWSRDNLLTPHPAVLYDGQIRQRLDLGTLQQLLPQLQAQLGFEYGALHLGAFTWSLSCNDSAGPFTLQLPLVLDAPGSFGRSKAQVPQNTVHNIQGFQRQGLRRFLPKVRGLHWLQPDLPLALLETEPGFVPLTFGKGRLQAELYHGQRTSIVSLGLDTTAQLLAEIIAALTYHYDPERDGGTALTDVFINDGDCSVRRRADGSFELKLNAARQLTPQISPSLFLLYLIQLLAFEDWSIDDELLGLPCLISNPALAFAGFVRGSTYRALDLGANVAQATAQAQRWIAEFAQCREGRPYRPWVECYLRGELAPSFGADPRERWWRTVHLEEKHNVRQLQARFGQTVPQQASPGALRSVLQRLWLESGVAPEPSSAILFNDLGVEALRQLLQRCGVAAGATAAIAGAIAERWPCRQLDALFAEVPGARPLRKLKTQIELGPITSDEDEGTLASFPKRPQATDAVRSRAWANAEVYAELVVDPALHAEAVNTFPSFEAYMDAALHAEHWGYYTRRVQIGPGGHFSTHPESLSPHFGRWLARHAFTAWRSLVTNGDLDESADFAVVEFGAGNGRLARDLLDSVDAFARDPAAPHHPQWQALARQLRYTIYETSPSLRQRQAEMLGARAQIKSGDARSPATVLQRDFAQGLRGLVLSNEVPDAFGVHKVALAATGEAHAALVVPRVAWTVLNALDADMAADCKQCDQRLRGRFALQHHTSDCYLDRALFERLMLALNSLPAGSTEAQLLQLSFEELYVPAQLLPELAQHLQVNAEQYALALAQADSGVLQYINCHADRYMAEVAGCLVAGTLLTIDYGHSTWELIQGARRGEFPFRVYCDGPAFLPRPNDPYTLPGMQDLTADINFTSLGQAGTQAGLKLIHYAPERDLADVELAELVAQARFPSIAEFLGNPVFKVLVLSTHSQPLFVGPAPTPLPLLRAEQDLPATRRPRARQIALNLEALTKHFAR